MCQVDITLASTPAKGLIYRFRCKMGKSRKGDNLVMVAVGPWSSYPSAILWVTLWDIVLSDWGLRKV